MIAIEQTARGTSHGARIAQEIQERGYDWLDHEIPRVSGKDSLPVASNLGERAALAGVEQAVAGPRRPVVRDGRKAV